MLGHNNYLIATLTDVKCAFSYGGLTVSKIRHSLSDKLTHGATVLGSWCGCQHNVVPQEEIMTLFISKNTGYCQTFYWCPAGKQCKLHKLHKLHKSNVGLLFNINFNNINLFD